MIRWIMFLLALASCGGTSWTRPASCPIPAQTVQNQLYTYECKPSKVTPGGIPYDDAGLVRGENPAKLDRIPAEVRACLRAAYDGTLPASVVAAAHCRSTHYVEPSPSCVAIKIASDTHEALVPYDGDVEQLLSERSPCDPAKPLPADGVCYYRSGFYGLSCIVTTPDARLLADIYTRVVTGCSDPWERPRAGQMRERYGADQGAGRWERTMSGPVITPAETTPVGNGNGNGHKSRDDREEIDPRLLRRFAREALEEKERLEAIEDSQDDLAEKFSIHISEWQEARDKYQADIRQLNDARHEARRERADLKLALSDIASGARSRDQEIYIRLDAHITATGQHFKRNDASHEEMNSTAADRHAEILGAIRIATTGDNKIRVQLESIHDDTELVKGAVATHAKAIAWRSFAVAAAVGLGGFFATLYSDPVKQAIGNVIKRLFGAP